MAMLAELLGSTHVSLIGFAMALGMGLVVHACYRCWCSERFLFEFPARRARVSFYEYIYIAPSSFLAVRVRH